MVLFEDDRFDYGEQRVIGVGLLDDLVVLIVHVESEDTKPLPYRRSSRSTRLRKRERNPPGNSLSIDFHAQKIIDFNVIVPQIA